MATATNGDGALVQLSKAKRALESAKTFEDVRCVVVTAEAARAAAKKANLSADVVTSAVDLKVRAERRAGEMIASVEKHKGAAQTQSQPATAFKLSEIGVSRTQSSRWQSLARIPAETYEAHVAAHLESGKELTSASVFKLVERPAKDKPKPKPLADAPWTLNEALEHLGKALRPVCEAWPAEYLETLGHRLRAYGDEILDNGRLREC